jgi:hypothetical protein
LLPKHQRTPPICECRRDSNIFDAIDVWVLENEKIIIPMIAQEMSFADMWKCEHPI